MVEAWSEALAAAIASSGWWAPLAALLGGLLTAANPCVLASVPLLMGYVGGRPGERTVARSFALALTFTAGLTAAFLILFLTTWAASSWLRASWWTPVAAVVCLLVGLHLLGVVTVPLPSAGTRQPGARGFAGALALGLLFGLISMPCAGPVLLALLALVPVRGPVFGGTLLAAYSLGHCALILAGGTSVGLVERILASRGLGRARMAVQRAAGGLIVAVGLYLLFA
jgi:cytochrome c-type biogenesis protein